MQTKLRVTPIGRLSYPSLFEPKKSDDGGTDYYEATLIFPANADLSELETAIDEAAEAKWGKTKAAMLKKVKYFPIKSNEACTDAEGKRRGGYEEDDGRHAKFKNSRAPGVVGRDKDPQTGKWVELKKDEIYPGCYVRASYTCFAGVHEKAGPYVRLSLQNIQKMADGEPLAGIISNPDDDFADDEAVVAALA